jgi:hypothetical protein
MTSPRWLTADRVITLLVIGLTVWMILQARAWPFRASLFPVLTASVVLGLAILKLVVDARRPAVARNDEEDVIVTATRSMWASPLGWMAAFFVGLWAFGILIAVPVFAFVYLVFVSKEHVLLAATYAGVAWAFVYVVFDRMLHIPLPTGL